LGRWTQAAFAMSERRVARPLPIQLAILRYRTRRDPQLGLRMRLRELAANRVRFGYRRLTVLLRREGLKINHKRVYRLYREEGLSMRMRGPRRHVSAARRMERPQASAANQCWSMDFGAP
jgi:putative transposase